MQPSPDEPIRWPFFAEQFSRLLSERGVTLYRLDEDTALRASNLSKMKAGRRRPTDEALRILREPGPTSVRAGVPAGVSVAAKPGGLDGVRTEVALVDVKDRPYLICVMTSLLADDAAGDRAIPDLARLSHAYFARLAAAGVEGRLLRPIAR